MTNDQPERSVSETTRVHDDLIDLLEECMGAQEVSEPHAEEPESHPVVLEPSPDGQTLRYKRPKDLQAPGFGMKMLEALDAEAMRKQLRALWGSEGQDANADLLAFAMEDALAELEPRDSLERLLAQQMFVVHRQMMTMVHRANDHLSPRDVRGHNDVVTRLATTYRRHYEEFRKHRAPAASVAIHGDGNTINLAAAQQIIAEGDPAQVEALVGALEGLTGALRNKLGGEDAPE